MIRPDRITKALQKVEKLDPKTAKTLANYIKQLESVSDELNDRRDADHADIAAYRGEGIFG